MHYQYLGDLERQTYRAFLDDGFADVLLGGFLLGFGLTMATQIDYLPAVLTVLAVPLWRQFRRTVVEPRLGYVRLSPTRLLGLKRRAQALGILMLLVSVTLWVLVLGRSHVEPVPQFHSLAPGLALAITTTVGGVLFDLRRLHWYAGLLLLTSVISYTGGLPAATGLLASGVVIVGSGLVVLSRFIRRYPPTSDDGGGTNA